MLDKSNNMCDAPDVRVPYNLNFIPIFDNGVYFENA